MERQTHFGLSTLGRGFAAAKDRLAESTREFDTERSFQSLLEALAWAGLLQDKLGARSDAVPELKGLWYVRNLVLHQGADVLLRTVIVHGTELGTWVLGQGVLGAATQYDWKWAPRGLLPQPKSSKGAREYDAYLSDHVVSDTLHVVAQYVDGVVSAEVL